MGATNRNRIKLFVTIEQRLYREALLIELVNLKNMELVGESSSGADTLRHLAIAQPSTLIIEENLKDTDGLTIAEIALSRVPSLTVVLLVENEITKQRLSIYLDSGIKSVVSKQQSIKELVHVLNYTQNGQVYVDADLYRQASYEKDTSLMLGDIINFEPFYLLSEREQEVAGLIAEHWPIKNIATQLGLSDKTIHTYKERILVKLGLDRLAELIVFMKRLKFYHASEKEII